MKSLSSSSYATWSGRVRKRTKGDSGGEAEGEPAAVPVWLRFFGLSGGVVTAYSCVFDKAGGGFARDLHRVGEPSQ